MAVTLLLFVLLLLVIGIGYWWRFLSLACPAGLSWIIENPYTNAVASPAKIFSRIQLTEGMKVIDIGCGPGRLAIPAARQVGPAGEVVALDIQEKMLNKLSARLPASKLNNLHLMHAAAGAGQLRGDYFDRALLVTVLGEIPNKADALLEIHHTLKPGGILSITELIPDPHYMSKHRVEQLCSDAGFQAEKYFGHWYAYTFNFIKPE